MEYPAGLVGDMLDFKFAFEGSGFGEFVNAWIILEASRESLGMDLSSFRAIQFVTRST